MNHEHNKTKPATIEKTVYTCPMHPNIVRNMPGMCPECGMALMAQTTNNKRQTTNAEHKMHDKHEGHHTEDFLRKFWVVLALTVPILVYSEIFEKVFHSQPPQFLEQQYVILVLGSIIFFGKRFPEVAGLRNFARQVEAAHLFLNELLPVISERGKNFIRELFAQTYLAGELQGVIFE